MKAPCEEIYDKSN